VDVVFYQPWIGPLLAATPGTATGGAETHVFLVARGLARLGHRVCLVTWPIETPLPRSVEGVEVVPMPRLRRVFPITRMLRVLLVARAMMRLDTAVIVQKNAEFDTGLVGLVARLRRRRFVWAASNLADFDYRTLGPSRTNRFMFRLGVRLANRRVVQTAEQRDLCERRFGLPATVIRNPCEPLPERSGEPRAFLWVARLAPYKRPEVFVELARALPQARFWMIGLPTRPSEQERLLELQRTADTLPNLELLVPRPRRELLELMSSVVAVVNTADFEGMSNVLLESWARGVPALALTHDPDGVIEREALGGFAHGSFDRLVELTAEMWEMRYDQAQVARRCREYVSREHAPEAVLERWASVLELAPPRTAREAA
jgi:glycosyltransferase involved in cell wall biosynthesis